MHPKNRIQDERRPRGGVALLGTIGGYSVLFILAGLAAGFLLDHFLHTFPVFLLVGVLAGFAGSMFQIYRLAMQELDN